MTTIFFSPKGGNCTTVTAAAHAIVSVAGGRSVCLVDLCGDLPAALGVAEPDGPGVNDWLSETCTSGPRDLLASAVTVAPGLGLVHRGADFVAGRPRWEEFSALVSGADLVVDAGTSWMPPEVRAAARSVLVTRPCYLSLRRAARMPSPSRVCVVAEPGRALTVSDVAHVLGTTPVRVPWEPAIGRAVDAGLLVQRAAQLFGRSFADEVRDGATI